mgnify:FL=1
MLLVNIFNFIKGYVVILVEGYYLERFLNICSRRQIYLWDVKKLSKCTMRLKISINGFRLLRPIAYKTKCRVKILTKRGLPFVVYRYRKRKTFIVGILLFCALLWYMTSFIWVIEITGNENISTEEIMENLEQCGLKVGTYKAGLDTDNIQNEMMLRLNRLSWIGLDVKGTKVNVEIKERRLAPPIFENHIPCNIIASKDGVIKEMVVKNGQPAVKEGDTVTKGQLLISGVLDSKVEGVRYVHSLGSVKARTWYEKSKEMKLIKTNRIPTGREIKKYSVTILGQKINLYINSGIPYEDYDKITYNNELSFGKDYIIPITIHQEQYKEIVIEKEKIPVEQAVEEGTRLLQDEFAKEAAADIEILNQNVEHIFVDENTVVVKYTVECMEEIGVQEQIME